MDTVLGTMVVCGIGVVIGWLLAASWYSVPDPHGPKPDWGRAGTQPRGSAGPKPRPNGRPVAMLQPVIPVTNPPPPKRGGQGGSITMKGLTEGRVVHYVMPDGTHRAAIVCRVFRHAMPPGYEDECNLQVFLDGSNDGADHSGSILGSLWWRTSVRYDAMGEQPNTWHWPEREEGYLMPRFSLWTLTEIGEMGRRIDDDRDEEILILKDGEHVDVVLPELG